MTAAATLVWVAIVAVAALVVDTEISNHKLRKLEKRAEELLRDAKDLRRRIVEARAALASAAEIP